MRNSRILTIIVMLLAFIAGCGAKSDRNVELPPDVRPAAVAGKFYPAEAGKLRRAVEWFMEDARPPVEEDPVAILVPHAGYVYCGQIIADGFNQAAGKDFDVIVILGTNHTTPAFTNVSIYARGGFNTPLGTAAVDEKLAGKLIELDERYSFDPAVHKEEHSIEVEVPFVQTLFPDTPILPVIIGSPDPELCRDFGNDLAKALAGRRPLIVASSDLSHYPFEQDADTVDTYTLLAVETFNPDTAYARIRYEEENFVPPVSTCACGLGPILAAMTAARGLGAMHATILSYANSADVAVGDISRVVGYGAAVFARGEEPENSPEWRVPPRPKGDETLADSDRKQLLVLARKTVTRYVTCGMLPLVRDFSPAARVRHGAFVTLNKNDTLRGCIGHMKSDLPLCNVVSMMALHAAINDRRFSPVKKEELDSLQIEISVLTPFKRVLSPDEIVVGRDGVMLSKMGMSAVFLPQVAVEQGWDRTELLDNLCLKAGLRSGSWKKGADLFVFQADVFDESLLGK